jgi:HAD superfamily hydrolase (TIGR01509 family)
MKKPAALIFDCDGVMFESKQANIEFYSHIARHFGLGPLGEADVEFVHMHTADESLRHLFRGSPHLEEALAYRLEMDYTPFIDYMVMEPGLKELLAELKPYVGLAVATNRSNTIGKVLEWNGLSGYFDIVVSSLDVTLPKPHPECIHKILNHFELPAARSFYVGDSLVDEQTAEAAGVPFISYKNKHLRAVFHVDQMKEIGRIVRRSGLLQDQPQRH